MVEEQLFALKKIAKSSIDNPKRVQHVYTERNILRSLQSDFIVQLKDTFTDELNVCFVFDYLPGKNLFQLL